MFLSLVTIASIHMLLCQSLQPKKVGFDGANASACLEKRDLLRKGMKYDEVERISRGSKLDISILGSLTIRWYHELGVRVIFDPAGKVVDYSYLQGQQEKNPAQAVAGRSSARARGTVLDKVIGDILTNPSLKELRLRYTKEEKKRFCLINNAPKRLDRLSSPVLLRARSRARPTRSERSLRMSGHTARQMRPRCRLPHVRSNESCLETAS
jgi:hypothetical protein